MSNNQTRVETATVARLKEGVTNFTQEDARYYMRLNGTEALILHDPTINEWVWYQERKTNA